MRQLTPRRAFTRAAVTIIAWAGLAAFDLARIAGFARLHEWVRTREVHPRRRDTSHVIEDVIWALDEACVWYVKEALCLQRSVVATCLLRRRGVPAEMVIGYRPMPFESHAWVEVGGTVVNDLQQYPKVFTVLERL